MSYHVVVIGAGPGGAVLAAELANRGIKVTIFEKGNYDGLGHDWSDAVEISALQEVGIEIPALEGSCWRGSLVKDDSRDGEGLFEPHAIPHLQLFSPGYQSVKNVEFRMLTTDRRALGQELIRRAEAAGAEIVYRYQGLGLLYRETGKNGADGVEVYGVSVKDLDTGRTIEAKANLVVESSGFNCVLRSTLPEYTGLADKFNAREFALVHREIRTRDPEKAAEDVFPDHYRYGFHTGYQWSHLHHSGRIDVGAGVKNNPQNPDPKDLIEEFISRHPSIQQTRLGGGRSLCIVGKPLYNFITNGFLVLGDAASTSVPTTGCGAGSAMLMGLWASRVIAEAASENRADLAKLWAINTKFNLTSARGASFAALAGLRAVLQDLQHDDLDFLFRQDIMDAFTLQNAVNGIFEKPGGSTKIKSLLKGIPRPGLLAKLNLATSGAARIYDHYQNYPEIWNEGKYNRWLSEAERLFKRY